MSATALVQLSLVHLTFGLFFCTIVASFTGMELELVRMEQVNGSHLINMTTIRVRKYNRTVAVMDGEFEVLQDLDNSYEFRITFAYSSLGNNQFVEYPMKIAQEKICKLLNSSYREYHHLWANSTNFPIVGEEGLCPFPKGVYWARNWAPDASEIPPVVPEAYWRMAIDILDEQGTIQYREFLFMNFKRRLI